MEIYLFWEWGHCSNLCSEMFLPAYLDDYIEKTPLPHTLTVT